MEYSEDIESNPPKSTASPTIAVVVHHQDHYLALLSSGVINAKANQGILTVFCITSSDEIPGWYFIPPGYEDEGIILKNIAGEKAINKLLKDLKLLKPALVGFSMNDKDGADRYLAGEKFEPILQQLSCPVYVLKSTSGWIFKDSSDSAFIPFWDDRNTRFAIQTALDVNPNIKITAGKVLNPSVDEDELRMQEEEFQIQTKQWENNPRFKTKLLFSFDQEKALLGEAKNFNLLFAGASKGNQLARTLFGDYRNRLVNHADGPAIILRESQGRTGTAMFKGWSFLDKLLPTLTREDRIEAYRQVRRSGRPNRDFYSMIALSAGIASLGLLLNSTAVIIGAMLVAPLMSAIIGMGMAIIQGDMRFLMLTCKGVVRGAAVAVLAGFLFGFINFEGEVTQEVLNRTEPSSLDLAVALISGVAAAYALSRKNVANSLPGVAIAVALVPPLATIGVCLSIGLWGLAYGAFKLFLSNLVAIVFASAVVFASLGFKPNIDTTQDHRRLKVFQRSFLASGILVVLMFGILISQTVEEVEEASINDKVQLELTYHLKKLGIKADVSDWKISTTQQGGFKIDLQLKSANKIIDKDVEALEEKLEESLKKPVILDITVIPVDLFHAD
jgi:uncharacterized hydrophobic protein (TIGR00271 family)